MCLYIYQIFKYFVILLLTTSCALRFCLKLISFCTTFMGKNNFPYLLNSSVVNWSSYLSSKGKQIIDEKRDSKLREKSDQLFLNLMVKWNPKDFTNLRKLPAHFF